MITVENKPPHWNSAYIICCYANINKNSHYLNIRCSLGWVPILVIFVFASQSKRRGLIWQSARNRYRHRRRGSPVEGRPRSTRVSLTPSDPSKLCDFEWTLVWNTVMWTQIRYYVVVAVITDYSLNISMRWAAVADDSWARTWLTPWRYFGFWLTAHI